ncbi:MAG: hypothetical protein EOO92_13905, partial [Pedobacter sp.]
MFFLFFCSIFKLKYVDSPNMRKTLLLLLLLCTKLTFAQLNDNFADDNFTNNPTWGGSTTNFQVIDGVLTSNGPNAAGTYTPYLSTPNLLASNVAWEFYLNLGFDPSTTNYPRIYLISNQQDLSSTTGLQGYYLQLGSATSAENFSFARQNGATITTLLTLPDKTRPVASSVGVRVRVERTSTGRWDIYTDFTGGRNFTHDGFIVDNTYTSTSYFGVYCRYNTASRYNLFKFDDFKIETYIDNAAPKVSAIKSLNTKTIEVTFDEPIDVTSAQTITNYSLSKGAGTPLTATMGSTSNVVNLTYANDFTSGEYTLTVNNVADVKGNAITTAATKAFIYVEPYTAQKGDVIFNEIMAAPSNTGILNKEYFELYNTTDKYIIITGWKYKDATATNLTTFGADTLAPKSYRIVCANGDVDQYKVYGKTLGISPWLALNNDKDDLNLFLPDGTTVIDFVSYADTWYGDNNKKTGYALELINPTGSCGGAFNWTASSGTNNGTPGAQNSVYNPQHTDNVAPKLLSATILSTTEVKLDFDKAIATAMLTDVNNYSINNNINKPISVVLNGTTNQSVTLNLATPILVGSESLLTISNLSNCNGVPINPNANTAVILLTDAIKAGEILISEVLFNERTGGAEFVEVYNPTSKILDLKELQISNASFSGTNDKKAISTTSVFIRPKTYWVLTKSPDAVTQQYDVKYPQQMVQVSNLPAYTNESGSVKLWKADELIDELSYTEKMHHALLKEVKGVSLERVSFTKSANEPGNLQSAAASVGYATPTYQNSQGEDSSVKNSFVVVNKTFSPDNDGFEDLLQIDYRFKENGNLATINIYTDKGVLVRRLARNTSMSTQGTITWDGLSDSGQLCKVGLYVIKV